MYLYNTLSKKKEKFEPIDPPFVKIYHCGITPYSESHVGHLRSEIAVDLLRRTLRFLGYIDVAISNFTDIDDKIINRAKELGVSWVEIPKKYIKYHLEAVRQINNLPFYINPKVTEHIGDISEFVDDLIKKGYGYRGNLGIYFEVDKFKGYGKLSNRFNPESWRQEEDVLQDKKKPHDFALWKFKKSGEPYWRTNVGEGRPGWHIECSTMSSKYLGKQFDIHSGGQDLIFPHHENEIAQSEARFGISPWVKYWFHIGYVLIEGEKMSKSLGNIIPAKEFISKVGPMETRFYLLSTHYRSPLDINEDSIEQYKQNYKYITNTIKIIISQVVTMDRTFSLNDSEHKLWKSLLNYHKQFIEYVLDDLNTTKATSILLEATKLINKEILPRDSFTLYYTAYEFYRTANRIYAVWDDVFYKGDKQDKTLQLLDILLEIRSILRKEKRYDLSDKIRDKLKDLGIELLDMGDKTIWKID